MRVCSVHAGVSAWACIRPFLNFATPRAQLGAAIYIMIRCMCTGSEGDPDGDDDVDKAIDAQLSAAAQASIRIARNTTPGHNYSSIRDL